MQWLRARELLREGRIGSLRAVQMFFGYNNIEFLNVAAAVALFCYEHLRPVAL